MQIHYRHEQEFIAIHRALFHDDVLGFSATTEKPFILDCGGHIGLSTLYFKRESPNAQIVTFEPDPENYQILLRNIHANQLRDVQAVNAAVARDAGSLSFFRRPPAEGSRGNSLMREWACHGDAEEITVLSERLSKYIIRPVDFLKLDIEGAEVEVLEEIRPRLNFVRQIYIEFHSTQSLNEPEQLDWAIRVLANGGFEVETSTLNLSEILPPSLSYWVVASRPRVTYIRAIRAS
jgi:FkbM family methyltransferase